MPIGQRTARGQDDFEGASDASAVAGHQPGRQPDDLRPLAAELNLIGSRVDETALRKVRTISDVVDLIDAMIRARR